MLVVRAGGKPARFLKALSFNLQIFSYSPNISAMSGVISPTNLSMYSPGVSTSRGTPRSSTIPRWSGPLFALDQEDFSMITHPVSTTSSEANAIILMDDGAAATAPDHTSQCCNSANLMCDADRFFQSGVTADGLENSATRDSDQLPTPKSP